jgi:hypothetical protein
MFMFLTNLFRGQGGFGISKCALQRTHEETLCIPRRNIPFRACFYLILCNVDIWTFLKLVMQHRWYVRVCVWTRSDWARYQEYIRSNRSTFGYLKCLHAVVQVVNNEDLTAVNTTNVIYFTRENRSLYYMYRPVAIIMCVADILRIKHHLLIHIINKQYESIFTTGSKFKMLEYTKSFKNFVK